LIRRTGLVIAAILSVHSAASAEIRIEERDGVLYVRNVKPPKPVVAKPSSPPNERIAARTAAPYRDLIRAAATRHALAPELIESVILVESNFEARAVSRKGARGLMQLMPATAARLGVRNVFDVRQNVEGGVRHLRYLVDLYGGNLALALAAYNAGVDAVGRYGGIPPYAETRAYVRRVLRSVALARLRVSAESAKSAEPDAARAALYRYETRDGAAVYSNLPAERLSYTIREVVEETR
jgi:soluble lytic murein transglycosylase-like protein